MSNRICRKLNDYMLPYPKNRHTIKKTEALFCASRASILLKQSV